MTPALVVFESLFGDNQTVARAVADGVSTRLPATAVEAARAPRILGPGLVLLVVGGPNHQFGMPRPASRQQASRDFGATLTAYDVGLREWLSRLAVTVRGIPAAAYDTRLDHPRFLRRMDHAARTAERMLSGLDFDLIASAEHFFVASATGPLVAGEVDRARRWGAALAEHALSHRA
jgi:hypothetical protein